MDQNSAVRSLEEALLPGASLVDGRTEQDWLCFLTEFASLINFYDHTNTIHGSWAPFLYKDPVFLLASIARTRFSKLHSLYLRTSTKLEQLLKVNEKVKDIAKNKDIPFSFNQLFDQLTSIFLHLRRWTYYMHRSGDSYQLKSYVLQQTQTKYSSTFWALVSLRQHLALSPLIKGIDPAGAELFELFSRSEDLTWRQNKDQEPYWKILGLRHPPREHANTDLYAALLDLFTALTKTGEDLFHFFHTVIQHATAAFEELKSQKSKYPDTLLLRTFVNLLQVHQHQLNEISQRHQHFYYQDILKQTKLAAFPDSVFLCAELAKKDLEFNLPAGTLFNAGTDAQKNQILFAAREEVSLNPAAITGAYTLSKVPGPEGRASLYLQNIANPGVVQQDETGKILNWATFGSQPAPQATWIKPGIAFASPLLCLREGERTILLTLTFADKIDPQLLQGAEADYYLSTQTDWLKVDKKQVVVTTEIAGAANPVTVQLSIDPNQAPIESFIKNPDGLDSSWPMLKITFNAFPGQGAPPVLKALTIQVTISNVRTFNLYNDYGALSTKTPFSVFGFKPLVNSSLIIGNNEIFSKPLASLSMELDWDNLPADFSAYYQQYNDFLGFKTPTVLKESAYRRWVIHLFSHEPKPEPVREGHPFNNACFTVGFQVLQNHSWTDFNMHNKNICTPSPAALSGTPQKKDTAEMVSVADTAVQLFSSVGSIGDKCNLLGYSIFNYNPTLGFQCNPDIQNVPLNLTENSSSGFIKMVLSGPVYGFGSEIYPAVVYDTALKNAKLLHEDPPPPGFIPPAQLPFAPRLKGISATYSASVDYTFNPAKETYPIQCFLYAPFKNYAVYDWSKPGGGYAYQLPGSFTSCTATPAGVPFMPAFNHDGYLFLEVDNLVPANALNIFFELARSYGASATRTAIDYSYLSSSGWKGLPVLSDGTNDFSCSGIVQVNVPNDITRDSLMMPAGKYWFSVAVNNPASFAQTVLIKTNGFIAQRAGDSISGDALTPRLASNAITKTWVSVPQLAAITQPFPSFGGKPAENQASMNQRVSNRLKTKDRVLSAEDYFRLIRQEYQDIYYSKTVFDPLTQNTRVYVIKAYETQTDPNAFLPMISTCREEEIAAFLVDRTSVFARVRVSNFNFQYVRVTATIIMVPGFEPQGVQKKVNQALNIFLSPWIAGPDPRIAVGQEISEAQAAGFISRLEGVLGVESVSFQTLMRSGPPGILINEGVPYAQTVRPLTESALIVSYMDHVIKVMQ